MTSLYGDTSWCECHDDLTAFGAVLVRDGYTAERLQDYYEKPWKWSDAYHRWRETGSIEATVEADDE